MKRVIDFSYLSTKIEGDVNRFKEFRSYIGEKICGVLNVNPNT